MKTLFTITFIVLLAQAVQADTLLKFKDGSANVWDNIYEKGDSYCTKKDLGEICAPKKDVVLKKEVPAGTDPNEYGGASAGSLSDKSDNVYAAGYTDKDEKRDKAIKAKRDQQEKDQEWLNKMKQSEERTTQSAINGARIFTNMSK